MNPRLWLIVVLLMGFGLTTALARFSISGALFTDPEPNGSNAFTTDTLQPPTILGASPGSPGEIALSWTASASTYAGGYNILRSTTAGCCYEQVGSVVGRLTINHTDTGLTSSTTYYYVLQTYYQSWTSANSNEASAVAP